MIRRACRINGAQIQGAFQLWMNRKAPALSDNSCGVKATGENHERAQRFYDGGEHCARGPWSSGVDLCRGRSQPSCIEDFHQCLLAGHGGENQHKQRVGSCVLTSHEVATVGGAWQVLWSRLTHGLISTKTTRPSARRDIKRAYAKWTTFSSMGAKPRFMETSR